MKKLRNSQVMAEIWARDRSN